MEDKTYCVEYRFINEIVPIQKKNLSFLEALAKQRYLLKLYKSKLEYCEIKEVN